LFAGVATEEEKEAANKQAAKKTSSDALLFPLLFNWLLVVDWICEQCDLMGTSFIYTLMLFLPLNV
jgi:hypothetical protein